MDLWRGMAALPELYPWDNVEALVDRLLNLIAPRTPSDVEETESKVEDGDMVVEKREALRQALLGFAFQDEHGEAEALLTTFCDVLECERDLDIGRHAFAAAFRDKVRRAVQ